jgi:hypothetical protein
MLIPEWAQSPCMEMGSPQMGFFLSASLFPYGEPPWKWGLYFLPSIESHRASASPNILAEKPQCSGGGVEAYFCCQKLSNNAKACTLLKPLFSHLVHTHEQFVGTIASQGIAHTLCIIPLFCYNLGRIILQSPFCSGTFCLQHELQSKRV